MALINCPECGKEISDKVRNCPNCGYPFKENENLQSEIGIGEENSKKKRRYGKIIIGLVVLALLSIGIVLFVQNLNPVDKFVSLVKDGKRDAAVALYDKRIKNNEEQTQQAKEIINKNIDDIYSQYYKDKLTYEEANINLQVYGGYEVSNAYVLSTKAKLDALDRSRKAYHDAQEAVNSNDIEAAIEKYSAVIKDDPNYADAAAKVKELRENLKKQLLDEAENYAKKKQYTKAIANIDQLISKLGSDKEMTELKEKYTKMKAEQYAKIEVIDKGTIARDTSKLRFNNYVTLVFKVMNNSEKNIVGIEGILTANDLFGKEIVTVGCDFTGMMIKPNKSYTEDDLSYKCNEFLDADTKFYNTSYKDLRFQYNITSIVYSDGTTLKPE